MRCFILMDVEQVLSRLEKVKQTGNDRYVACCPAHADSHPSLSITVTESGKILMHCHAGCAIDDVVSAIGLSFGDIMGDTPTHHRLRPIAHQKRPDYIPLEKGIDMDSYYRTVLNLAKSDCMKGIQSSAKDMALIQKAQNYFNAKKGVNKATKGGIKDNTIKALRVEYRRFLGL